MVIILELDDDPLDEPPHERRARLHYDVAKWDIDSIHQRHLNPRKEVEAGSRLTERRLEEDEEQRRHNPNLNGFTQALTCYPIVTQIAHSLDLNTLHALSLACRQVRANMLPCRRELVRWTLRCELDGAVTLAEVLDLDALLRRDGGTYRKDDGIPLRRRGTCARDLVGECRRCGRVICRNCIVKPPPSRALASRHRRLCPTCNVVPLACHTLPSSAPVESLEEPQFTSAAFLRGPCNCPESVWLCQSCGQSLGTADTTYMRVWTWRTRYSTYLGGLGTGIGEGNEGVKCGREQQCLAAREVEVEVDCEGDDLAATSHTASTTMETTTTAVDINEDTTAAAAAKVVDDNKETGYLRQEIEGIGGVVKKKLKIRVRVGAVVEEWEDERESSDYLSREIQGEERSWCGWCQRVIPGIKDEILEERHLFDVTLGGTNV
ncbi:MAG: hypothetical protein M1816_007728 [Peltula sp. TS41687]|nr:MAG: hypothetical protein M1816_007728 [Peltula sp. TS41687]